MLIDFHTHAFPERIAARAIGKLSHDAGGLAPQTDGTLSSLKEQMLTDGVDISVVHSIATSPKQQHNVNNFAMEIDKDDGIVAFGSVHPDAPDALEELERIHAAGFPQCPRSTWISKGGGMKQPLWRKEWSWTLNFQEKTLC